MSEMLSGSTHEERADACVVAIARAFQGDGEMLCNPIGLMPLLGGRLAATLNPDLVITDGFAMFAAEPFPISEGPEAATIECWNPYPQMFSVLWNGKRHVMMGATQVDQFGNQNIACIGDWHQPKAQLLGFRGAPGNTINHKTSYWVPNHSPKVFVDHVDVVCGIGYDRAAELGDRASRFHCVYRVISNLGVFSFDDTPDNCMRIEGLFPGVTVEQVQEATGFELWSGATEILPGPNDEQREIIERLDPKGLRHREIAA
jgi:acyl CoA:acetate/3-ketoacid CoA transferase beta subunit